MFIYVFILAGTRREFLREEKLCDCVAKCVTLTNVAKSPRKIDVYFLFAKSNLRHFVTLLLLAFMDKKLDISAK